MRKNEYLYDMLKSEEHAQEILVSQLNSEKRARRAAEKKAHDAELRISTLLDKVNDLQSKLDEQLGKVTELASQMTAMFMGNGAVSLSDSIKDSLVGAIRAEFEVQKQELIASFNREKQEMLKSFALQLAAKDNEIALLKGRQQDDPPATSSPQSGSVPPTADKDARIKQLEQQNANLNTSAYGQHTESLISKLLAMHFEDGMTLGDIEHWLKDKGVNFSHATIMGWFEKAAVILAPLDKPLQEEITDDAYMHSDESTLKTCDVRLPGKGEAEDDVEPEEHYFKRWIFCHYSPTWNLTQFIFHERGRRTREAEQKYLEEVSHKMYLHTDGALIYKCYDVCELIVRVACLVHMRRPLYKLKHVSADARQLVDIIDEIFHRDKKIKKQYQHPDDIKRERNLLLAPLLNDLKQELDRLHNLLDPEKEPELLKAVKYVLTEYPCILHCLEDGLVDLSNNCCERQIRRIAKYRNNSFFVGSPESGVRFARLQSVFSNIRNHKLNAVTYLCDVFRRIGKTAKEELVNLLPHKWQPMTVKLSV